MAAYRRVYDSRHLQAAKNRDQLRNPTLGNRVWANFTFLLSASVEAHCGGESSPAYTAIFGPLKIPLITCLLSSTVFGKLLQPEAIYRLDRRLVAGLSPGPQGEQLTALPEKP